jgi:DNA-binding transcriptional ArsR family regulator
MNIADAVFANPTRVKLMRLFLFNPTTSFLVGEIAIRVRSARGLVSKELSVLLKAGLIKKRLVTKEVSLDPAKKPKRMKGSGYQFNEHFQYTEALKNFLTITSLHADDSLVKRFNNVGKIRLFVAAGVFVQNWDSRVDLLIVGEDLNLEKIETAIKVIESEIGKEISYSAFDKADFEYRIGIHDRLVRDILDYPHITLLDRLGVEPQ